MSGIAATRIFAALRSSNTRKRVLNNEAGRGGNAEFLRRAQVNVRMWLAASDFVACDNRLEKASDSGPLKKRARGVADRTGGYREVQLHLAQLFQSCFCRRKQTHTFREKLGGNFATTPHQFLNRCGDVKSVLVKLDRDPVAYAQHVAVIFAVIRNAIFGE